MFCPSCGKELKDGSKFCKYCGYKIKPKANESNISNHKTNTAQDNKERNEKILIGVLIAAIAVLAIVFVAFGMGLFNGDSSQSANDNSQSSSSAPSSKSVSLSSFPVSEAPALAQAIKNSGGNFPINFRSLSLSKAQCLYILSKSISLIAAGDPDATISVGDPSYAPHPSGRDYSQNILRTNYVDMCNRFSSWIESNGQIPNYIGIYGPGVADVSPSRMLDICVSILIDYGNTKSLPASINI